MPLFIMSKSGHFFLFWTKYSPTRGFVPNSDLYRNKSRKPWVWCMMPRAKMNNKQRKQEKEQEDWWVMLEAAVKKTSETGHLSWVKWCYKLPFTTFKECLKTAILNRPEQCCKDSLSSRRLHTCASMKLRWSMAYAPFELLILYYIVIRVFY